MPDKIKIEGWRKIAAATWSNPKDPQIFGDLEVDATASLNFLEDAREATGARVTMTHMVGKALAVAFGENPDLNVRLYRGHFVQRETVDIFFIVSAGKGLELSGVKVRNADEKPVVEIASELAGRAEKIRTGRDAEFGKTKTNLGRTPHWALHSMLKFAAWLTVDRDMDLKRFGLPRQAFGSAMVSSVGMFGIQHAYAPLSPYYRVPMLVLVGEVAKKPVVIDDKIEVRPVVSSAATLDHRYLDGYHAARLARSFRAYLEDPKRFEPALK
ncbi:MAG: 2-oxo acid dehydrogenase subunit E2 [Actinomycetota bacterium]|nr:2-oxo acid dehydrogenase subunit E2 [Actinomycetota bacterium]